MIVVGGQGVLPTILINYRPLRYCSSFCDVFTVFSFSSLITAENALKRGVPASPASDISTDDQTLRDVSDVGVRRRRSRSW